MQSFDERIAGLLSKVTLSRDRLHRYQGELAIPFLYENPYSGLFIDMGLGKTISSLTVIADLLGRFAMEQFLIVGPLRVATETWPNEIESWEHVAPYGYNLIHVFDDDPRVDAVRDRARNKARRDAAELGLTPREWQQFVTHQGQKAETAEKNRIRAEAARRRSSINIISRDWVEWLVNFHGPKWPYRGVIIDESSSFKDHTSSRFKALAKVRNTPGLIQRLHILTATPAAETYEHLFAQIFLLDGGERFGKGITKFRERYFVENRYNRRRKLRPGAKDEITEKIKDICMVLRAEEYLDVKKPIFVERKICLSKSQMDLYRKLEKDFVITLPDGTEIEAETAAELSQKLLQMASGTLYESYLEEQEDGEFVRRKRVHQIHDAKLDVLREIVEESQGEPILIAYWFKSTLDRLKKAFPKAVIMDREGKCVKDWNARKIPLLFVHPQSAGHGLNLQHGGHTVVYFDLPCSLELYLQLIGRLARQGQKSVVTVHMLMASGTRDEEVYAALQDKENFQDAFLESLKRRVRKYRAELKKGSVADFTDL